MAATFSETEFSLSGFLKPDPNDPSDPNYSLSYTHTHTTLLTLLSKRCGSGVETTIFDRWYESPLPPAERKGLKQLRIRTINGESFLRAESGTKLSIAPPITKKRQPKPLLQAAHVERVPIGSGKSGLHFVKALGYKPRCRGKEVGRTFRQGAATITVFQVWSVKPSAPLSPGWVVQVKVHGPATAEIATNAAVADAWCDALEPYVEWRNVS